MVGRSRGLRWSVAAAVGVAGVLLSSGCAVSGGEAQRETVLVGVDLELTGSAAELGKIYLAALEMRVEQVNQQGLLGNRELELRVLDNRSDAQTAVANLHELFDNPSVSAVISGQCAACVVNAAESLEIHELPVIALTASDEVIDASAHQGHLFKLGPNAAHNAGALIAELRSEVDAIAVVATGDRYGQDGLRETIEAAERAGIEVVSTTTVGTDEESVLEAVPAIFDPAANPEQTPSTQPEEGTEGQFQQPDGQFTEPGTGSGEAPEAVVVWTPGPVAADLAVALREAGYEGEFLLDAVAADEIFLAVEASEALDGARMIFTETLVIDDVIATSPAKAARQAWFRDYLSRHGTYHAYSSFAADAIQLIVEGINRLDSTEPDAVRAGIEATQIEGLTGPLRMTAENHSALMPQALTTVVARGDRWRLAN